MSRLGFRWFRFDCDFFDDIKIRLLSLSHKNDGKTVYIYILKSIFSSDNGCYIEENQKLYMETAVANDMEIQQVKKVIDTCVEVDLFNAELRQRKHLLTSKSIQEYYCDMCVSNRRTEIKIPKDIILCQEYYNECNTKIEKKKQNYKSVVKVETPSKESETPSVAVETPSKESKTPSLDHRKEKSRKEKNIIDIENNKINPSSCSSLGVQGENHERAAVAGSQEKEEEKSFFVFPMSCARYSDEVTNEEYFQIVRRMMCCGAAHPCEEANEYIRIWASNGWQNKYGKPLDKVQASLRWKVRAERKLSQGGRPWMSADYRRQVDEWLRLCAAAALPQEVMNDWRAIAHQAENGANLVILTFASDYPLQVIENSRELLKPLKLALKRLYGEDVRLEYRILK